MRFISRLLWSIFILAKLLSARKLLLLMLDGFRWDYIDNTDLRGFAQMKTYGAYVRKVHPVFPADCHPNIYSIFTGLYPQHHGVLGNRVYSTGKQIHFNHDNKVHRRDVHEWVHAEPLWVTSRRQGRQSFTYHLPICESSSGPLSPTHCVPYHPEDMTLRALNNSVREALRSLESDVAHLAVVYNDQLDRLTHLYGPESRTLSDELLPALDALLQATLEEVRRARVHLVVLSDHGMAQIAKERQIFLERLLLRSQVDQVVNQGAYAGIWPRGGRFGQVRDQLLMAQAEPSSNFRLYTDSSLPAHWGALHRDLSPPLLMVASAGYFIVSRELDFPYGSDFYYSGWHGYAPDSPEMASPMLAIGPDIAPGVQVESTNVTNIYQLLAHLVEVSPLSHNGSISFLAQMLTGPGPLAELDLSDSPVAAQVRSAASAAVTTTAATATAVGLVLASVALCLAFHRVPQS